MPPATMIGHTQKHYGLQLYTHATLLQPIQFKIIPTQHILTTRRKLMEKKRMVGSKINNHHFFICQKCSERRENIPVKQCNASGNCLQQIIYSYNLSVFTFSVPCKTTKIILFLFVICRSLSTCLFYNPARINCGGLE